MWINLLCYLTPSQLQSNSLAFHVTSHCLPNRLNVIIIIYLFAKITFQATDLSPVARFHLPLIKQRILFLWKCNVTTSVILRLFLFHLNGMCLQRKILSLNYRRSFVNFTRYFVHINWKNKQKRWNINVGDTEVIHVSSSHYWSWNFLRLRNSLAYHRWQTLNIIQRQSKLDQILSHSLFE